jgi:6-carboxyhexanoate--CoA ligase
MSLYSLKIRASRQEGGWDEHISGAERIVAREDLETFAAALLLRALSHSRGEADFISLKAEKVRDCELLYIDVLPVSEVKTASVSASREQVCALLAKTGLTRGREIMAALERARPMRGAMLLAADTLRRLEPDQERGIRVTGMDYAGSQAAGAGKQHFAEALALASKVAHHPDIVAEVCVSDDPDYVTGYVASRKLGYVRVTPLKTAGSPRGGRIFLYGGAGKDIQSCIDYLQTQPVLIRRSVYE